MRSIGYLRLVAILASIVLGVSGQLLLKAGMNKVNIKTGTLIAQYLQALTSLEIWGGLFCFGVSMLIWLYVLARLDISVAYPFLGLNYILIMIGSRLIFHEPINWWKVVGSACIILGILLVAQGFGESP
ncbi:MAG: EamA family transporter [Chloroflexi bacterium]|nr:EamA family transporter [Chloroflexota bacterium]